MEETFVRNLKARNVMEWIKVFNDGMSGYGMVSNNLFKMES